MTVSAAIAAFLAHLRREVAAGDTAPGTLEYYTFGLAHLEELRGDVELAAITVGDLLFCPRTPAVMRSVRRLFRFHGMREPQGIHAPQEGQRERTVDPVEFRWLCRAAVGQVKWMLRLSYRAGLRPQEVRDLEWGDVKEWERFIKLTRFKAKKRRQDGLRVRFIPLPPEVARLFRYVRHRIKPKPHDLVFVNRYGHPWTSNAYRLAVRRAREKAGLKSPEGEEQLTATTMRHTFATRFVRGDPDNPRPVDVTLLADILGHTTLSTTKRYLHRTPADLVKGLDTAFPRKRRRGA